MTTVSLYNIKGGAGKTTTAVNLAGALAEDGIRVMLVDLCPQGDATTHLGAEPGGSSDPVSGRLTPIYVKENLRLAWASPRVLLAYEYGQGNFDLNLSCVDEGEVVIIDCPPAAGRLSLAAIRASSTLIMPVAPSLFSLNKIGELTDILADSLESGSIAAIPGIWLLLNQVDERQRVDRGAVKYLDGKSWNVFSTQIRKNTDLVAAPNFKTDIFGYKPGSTGAVDYRALEKEVIREGII